jgi:hypothetical protein
VTIVTVTATDAAHNSTTGTFKVTVVDTTKPVLTVPADITIEATSAAGASVTFAATATDLVTATPTITYSTNPGSTFALGVTTVTVTATDAAHNSTTKTFKVTVVDTTKPTGSIAINGGADSTADPNVTVMLTFTDAVGPAKMRFSTDGGANWSAWETYATTKMLTLPGPDGLKTVSAQVADAAGNVGTASDSITLSTARPTIVVTGISAGQSCDLCSTFSVKITVTGSVASTTATLDGNSFALTGTIDPFYLTAGDHMLRISARNSSGRELASKTIVFSVHATIEGLECAVHRAVGLGLVAAQQEQPLIAKLEVAKASRDRGKTAAEINQLQAFVYDLQAQRGRKSDAAFADRAIGWTNDLISRIGGGGRCGNDDDNHHGQSGDDNHGGQSGGDCDCHDQSGNGGYDDGKWHP